MADPLSSLLDNIDLHSNGHDAVIEYESDLDDDELPPPNNLLPVRADPQTAQARLLGLGSIHRDRDLSPVRRRLPDDDPEEEYSRLRDESPLSRPRQFHFADDQEGESNDAQASVDGLGEGLENYVPVQYEAYNFPLTVEERQSSVRPKYCFLCDTGQTNEEVMKNPRVEELKSYLYNNFHNTKPLTLATKAQNLYNVGIRKKTELDLVWRRQIIYEHVTEHHPAPRIIVEDNIRTLNHVRMTLRDNGLFKKDLNNANSKFKIDQGSLKMYMMVLQQQRVLLREADVMRTNASIERNRATLGAGTE
jgi:hypothetical protein